MKSRKITMILVLCMAFTAVFSAVSEESPRVSAQSLINRAKAGAEP